MVISYSYVLTQGQKSNAPGFGQKASWEPIENMVIVDRVSDKHMQNAELVLDLLELKVIKSRDGSLDSNQLFNTFVNRHFDDVKAALATWVAANPDNLQKVQAFVEAHAPKEEGKPDE